MQQLHRRHGRVAWPQLLPALLPLLPESYPVMRTWLRGAGQRQRLLSAIRAAPAAASMARAAVTCQSSQPRRPLVTGWQTPVTAPCWQPQPQQPQQRQQGGGYQPRQQRLWRSRCSSGSSGSSNSSRELLLVRGL